MATPAAGAPVTSVTGGDITSLGAYIANLLAQLRQRTLESGGYFDLAAAGGMNGLAPSLARDQLAQVRLDAERNFTLDLQRFGLQYAQQAFQQKLDAGTQQLAKLALQTSLQGPGDWLRYNYVENNAPGAPEPTTRDTGQGVNPPAPTTTMGAGGAGGGAGGQLALTTEQRAQNMAGDWNRAHPADNTRPEAQLGAAGIRGNAGVQHWDPAHGWIYTPDNPNDGGQHFDQASQQWGQAGPVDSQPDVNGLQAPNWTPTTYTDSPNQPGVDSSVQHAGGHTWDPNATGPVMLAFGGRSTPWWRGQARPGPGMDQAPAPAGSAPMHAAVIGDPQRGDHANPELAMSRAPIFVKPLKGDKKAQAMAKGKPRMSTGGVAAAPFVQKAMSGGPAFGGRGEDLGAYGRAPINYTNYLRLLPSEQAMTQGLINTPTELGGYGGWFADELERSRRSGFQGQSSGVSTYG